MLGSMRTLIATAGAILLLAQVLCLQSAVAQDEAPQAAPVGPLKQDPSVKPEKQTVSPTPRILSKSQGFFVYEGRAAEDVTIEYGIDGDLSQVAKAWFEVIDDHEKVVYVKEIPIQEKGEAVWPKGTIMEATPVVLSFQVKNPDGQDSEKVEVQAEVTGGDAPTQVLLSVTPARVVQGRKALWLTLKGRNFQPGERVSFSPEEGEGQEAKYNAQFVSSKVLRVRVPGRMTLKVGAWNVQVFMDEPDGWINNSSDVPLQIIRRGLPPPPILESIKPAKLPWSEDPKDKWITLRGRNFIKGNTKVLLMEYDSEEMETKFISSREMKARIPAIWFVAPGKTTIRAESASDPFLASRHLPLQVTNDVEEQAVPAPRGQPMTVSSEVRRQIDEAARSLRPEATSVVQPFDQDPPRLGAVNDGSGYLAIPPRGEKQPTTVTLRGSDFDEKSVVLADADGFEQELKTIFISSPELQAIVPTDLWGTKGVEYIIKLDPKDQTQKIAEGIAKR